MIRFKEIDKTYQSKSGEEQALKKVSLEIKEGTIHGIIGPSGAGKSTLIRVINQLEAHDHGVLDVLEYIDVVEKNKESTRMLRTKIGMIFQSFNLLESKNVMDNVLFPITLFRTPTSVDKEYATSLLETVGLKEYKNRYPAELSGGQRQRVGIARSLINRPKILLCDEPTSALDQRSVKQILALIKRIKEEQALTVVFVSHDMHVIKEICDVVTIMDKGEVVETNTIDEILLHPQHEATKLLTETVGYNIEQILADYAIEHTLYLLRFRKEAKERPLISELSQTHQVHLNILYANITPSHEGVLLVDIIGQEKDKVLKTLTKLGVDVTYVN